MEWRGKRGVMRGIVLVWERSVEVHCNADPRLIIIIIILDIIVHSSYIPFTSTLMGIRYFPSICLWIQFFFLPCFATCLSSSSSSSSPSFPAAFRPPLVTTRHHRLCPLVKTQITTTSSSRTRPKWRLSAYSQPTPLTAHDHQPALRPQFPITP